jgi:hypothetical protein
MVTVDFGIEANHASARDPPKAVAGPSQSSIVDLPSQEPLRGKGATLVRSSPTPISPSAEAAKSDNVGMVVQTASGDPSTPRTEYSRNVGSRTPRAESEGRSPDGRPEPARRIEFHPDIPSRPHLANTLDSHFPPVSTGREDETPRFEQGPDAWGNPRPDAWGKRKPSTHEGRGPGPRRRHHRHHQLQWLRETATTTGQSLRLRLTRLGTYQVASRPTETSKPTRYRRNFVR